MRIKITFSNYKQDTYLPINTNYHLVKLINKLAFEYHRYLNSLLPTGRPSQKFDLYTFSQLIIPNRKIVNFKIGILSTEFYWYIASPYYQFLGLLVKELNTRGRVSIAKRMFGVKSVEFVHSPVFDSSEALFTCLSPVAVYRQRHSKHKTSSFHLKSGYVLPDEKDYLPSIRQDLVQKYNTIEKDKIDNLDFDLQYDPDYIRKRNNRITKVITLENGESLPDQVRGVLAPLRIKASPEILRIVYDSGLGQLNSFGFGMVETVHLQH